MREITREIVSALIISQDNKILLGKKDPQKGGVYVNCWHLPGGGVNEGEDLISGVIREVKEETGLIVSSNQIELLDNQGKGVSEKTIKETGEQVICNMNFNVYRIDLALSSKEFELQPTDDLVLLCWFDLQSLTNLKLTPPSIELFSRISL